MGFAFPGGIGEIRIADADDFDTSGSANFLVVIDRNQIAKEGTEFPDPEAIKAELADDREVRMGVNQAMNIRLAELEQSDFDTLENQVDTGTEVFVEVTSAAKTGGSPIWKIVYQDVILSNILHGPVKADRSAYGTVLLDGMCTGFNSSDIYTLTQNAPA